jgi:hypothetical protein
MAHFHIRRPTKVFLDKARSRGKTARAVPATSAVVGRFTSPVVVRAASAVSPLGPDRSAEAVTVAMEDRLAVAARSVAASPTGPDRSAVADHLAAARSAAVAAGRSSVAAAGRSAAVAAGRSAAVAAGRSAAVGRSAAAATAASAVVAAASAAATAAAAGTGSRLPDAQLVLSGPQGYAGSVAALGQAETRAVPFPKRELIEPATRWQ